MALVFPLDEKNLFNGTKTIKEQNKSNFINLLLTQPGERINEIDFGVGIKNLLFENNIDLDNLQLKIKAQTARFLPEIEISTIETGLSDDGHTAFVTIVYENILDTTSETLQLNFR